MSTACAPLSRASSALCVWVSGPPKHDILWLAFFFKAYSSSSTHRDGEGWRRASRSRRTQRVETWVFRLVAEQNRLTAAVLVLPNCKDWLPLLPSQRCVQCALHCGYTGFLVTVLVISKKYTCRTTSDDVEKASRRPATTRPYIHTKGLRKVWKCRRGGVN